VVARDQGFKHSRLTTTLRSLIDIRGFFFDLHLQPKFEQLNFDLTFDTREPVKKLRALAAETHRRCPQLGIFRLAKIPMLVSWYRQGRSKPLFQERFSMKRGRTPEERLVLVAKRLNRKKRER